MFEKQLSITDILLYFIPGFLTVISISLICSNYQIINLLNVVLSNTTLQVVFILALSIGWGYIQSNLTMRMFRVFSSGQINLNPISWIFWIANKMSSTKYQNYFFLKNHDLGKEFNAQICENYRKVFLVNTSDKEIMESEEAYSFMMRYVDAYNLSPHNQYSKRSLNLSNFASSLLIPFIIMGLIIVDTLNVTMWIKILLTFFLVQLSVNILRYEYLSYRKSWIKNNFKNFLILSAERLRKD